MTKYTQGKDGYWSTLVWDGTFTADGQKRRKQIRSAKSSADLEKKVAEFKKAVEKHANASSTRLSFVDFAREWRRTYKANTRMNTIAMYDNIIEKHFVKLEYVPLTDIDKSHLYKLLNNASASTGRQIYITFKQVIKEAIRQRYLPQNRLDDIFADTSAPKVQRDEKKALTSVERDAIMNTTLEGMEKAYLWIAYGCGLRREEILALKAEDITSEGVKIYKVIVFDKNEPKLEMNTKSAHGRRCVPIPDFVRSYLDGYLPTTSGFIFKTKGRDMMSQSSYVKFWNRIKASIDEAVGYDTKLTSHRLRHNYCSSLCYTIPMISIKTIASLMGDTEAVILKVYNHILEEREDKKGAIEKAVGTLDVVVDDDV